MMATFDFIKDGGFYDALRLAQISVNDSHDLIHKAVGWMLREVGNRDMDAEEGFLRANHAQMPRTMLRYAIERFPEGRRLYWLQLDSK
jgi:3-methyladenine DNA glycosylase AlkD